jgi:2,4-dienoyl-CoA reductase-like NADH-dependent reductase (Old Yellow Enzyme family)
MLQTGLRSLRVGISTARPAIALRYQVSLAAAVKKASGIVVKAVGMIIDPHQAEPIVADGHADCVALAHGFSTTHAGPGMLPPRLAPMRSTRNNTCAPETFEPGAALVRR